MVLLSYYSVSKESFCFYTKPKSYIKNHRIYTVYFLRKHKYTTYIISLPSTKVQYNKGSFVVIEVTWGRLEFHVVLFVRTSEDLYRFHTDAPRYPYGPLRLPSAYNFFDKCTISYLTLIITMSTQLQLHV